MFQKSIKYLIALITVFNLSASGLHASFSEAEVDGQEERKAGNIFSTIPRLPLGFSRDSQAGEVVERFATVAVAGAGIYGYLTTGEEDKLPPQFLVNMCLGQAPCLMALTPLTYPVSLVWGAGYACATYLGSKAVSAAGIWYFDKWGESFKQKDEALAEQMLEGLRSNLN